MTRKILLSFLGTTNYIACNYYDEENHKQSVPDVRFVQEAIIQLFCPDYDRYYFFLTTEARSKNWEDDGHKDKAGKQIKGVGLKTRLMAIGLGDKISDIDIIEGYSKEEIWQIFNKIFAIIEKDDEITFDITHGFRSLPMLGMVLMNYTKTLRNINVKGIYYGAFEALGPWSDVRDMPMADRNAPILNLTSFSELQEWTIAANDFISYGVSSHISSLAQGSEKAKNFGDRLEYLTKSISTNRGKDLINGQLFRQLKQSIAELKTIDSSLAPLIPLLEEIDLRLADFNNQNDIHNLIETVKWCRDNKLIQQGITMLQEFIVVYSIEFVGAKWRKNSLHRTVMAYVLSKPQGEVIKFSIRHYKMKIKGQQLAEKWWHIDLINKLRTPYQKLVNLRNDINHAGLGKGAKNAIVFERGLHNSLQQVITIIEEQQKK